MTQIGRCGTLCRRQAARKALASFGFDALTF